jgi:hypothetical protein
MFSYMKNRSVDSEAEQEESSAIGGKQADSMIN